MKNKEENPARLGAGEKPDSKNPPTCKQPSRASYPETEKEWWDFISQREEELLKDCQKPCPLCNGRMMAKFSQALNKFFFICKDEKCSHIGIVTFLDLLGYDTLQVFLEWQRNREAEKEKVRQEEIKQGLDDLYKNRVRMVIDYESARSLALYKKNFEFWDRTTVDYNPQGKC